MKKKVPRLKTDGQAEAFLAQDLSNLDFAQFKAARFEFEKKDEQINMRVPKPLLAAVKARMRRVSQNSPFAIWLQTYVFKTFGVSPKGMTVMRCLPCFTKGKIFNVRFPQ
jgi:predicted DNA binding CopG/RHH family protein